MRTAVFLNLSAHSNHLGNFKNFQSPDHTPDGLNHPLSEGTQLLRRPQTILGSWKQGLHPQLQSQQWVTWLVPSQAASPPQ